MHKKYNYEIESVPLLSRLNFQSFCVPLFLHAQRRIKKLDSQTAKTEPTYYET